MNSFSKHLLNTSRLFRAISNGGYNCKEADDIRDELDPTWYEMTDEERTIVSELSAVFNELWDEREYFRVRCNENALSELSNEAQKLGLYDHGS